MPQQTTARGDRVALVTIQIAAFVVALAVIPWKAFDLDRFFVPKELGLHIAAALAAFALLTSRRRLSLWRVDALLVAFLGLSVASAVFATNPWLAIRATAISFSSVMLFWCARSLARDGKGRALVIAIAASVVVGAATALAQAYGVRTDYFSLNRAPGGTFGNRNFVAHLAAIGTPLLVLLTLAARRSWGALLSALSLVALVIVLVISRSRGAWLAAAVSLGAVALGLFLTRKRWRDARRGSRLSLLALALVGGVAAAVLVPNTLNWKSDNPYLESAAGVVNYKEGSGAGRLVQYRNSVRMAVAHPLLGVGPGNWAVVYPKYASRNDPSFSSDDMTANPWPSSDWVAFVSERGWLATAALALAFLALALGALRQVRDARSPEQVAASLALVGVLVATFLVGAFDAVLLLAAPAMVVWPLLGALAVPPRSKGPAVGRGVPEWAPVLVAIVAIVSIGRSALQLSAMATYGDGTRRLTTLERAARLDPGNYRLRVRLASSLVARGDCGAAAPHARAAHALFPNAPQPRQLLAACGLRAK